MRRDGSYRYNVIVNTPDRRGVPANVDPFASESTRARYIDLFSSFAHELFLRLAGCLQSNENLLAGQIFFRRHSARSARVSPTASSSLFTPPPRITRRSISSRLFIRGYTQIFSAGTCGSVRARLLGCLHACVRDGEGANYQALDGGIGRKINNCRKEFIGLKLHAPIWKMLVCHRYFLIISLLCGNDADSGKNNTCICRCMIITM